MDKFLKAQIIQNDPSNKLKKDFIKRHAENYKDTMKREKIAFIPDDLMEKFKIVCDEEIKEYGENTHVEFKGYDISRQLHDNIESLPEIQHKLNEYKVDGHNVQTLLGWSHSGIKHKEFAEFYEKSSGAPVDMDKHIAEECYIVESFVDGYKLFEPEADVSDEKEWALQMVEMLSQAPQEHYNKYVEDVCRIIDDYKMYIPKDIADIRYNPDSGFWICGLSMIGTSHNQIKERYSLEEICALPACNKAIAGNLEHYLDVPGFKSRYQEILDKILSAIKQLEPQFDEAGMARFDLVGQAKTREALKKQVDRQVKASIKNAHNKSFER